MPKNLKLYHISQEVNNGYDTYDSAVVCAESEEVARNTQMSTFNPIDAWCEPKDVNVQLIGIAHEDIAEGIIWASFNAG